MQAETPRSARGPGAGDILANELEQELKVKSEAVIAAEDEIEKKQKVAYKLEEERDQALELSQRQTQSLKRLKEDHRELMDAHERVKDELLDKERKHNADPNPFNGDTIQIQMFYLRKHKTDKDEWAKRTSNWEQKMSALEVECEEKRFAPFCPDTPPNPDFNPTRP